MKIVSEFIVSEEVYMTSELLPMQSIEYRISRKFSELKRIDSLVDEISNHPDVYIQMIPFKNRWIIVRPLTSTTYKVIIYKKDNYLWRKLK